MKNTLLLLSTVFFLNVFCSNTSNANLKNKKIPPNTTFDSLQGKWKWVLDTDHICIINGRTYSDIYMSSDTSYKYTGRGAFKIYFSDTIVNRFQEYTFQQVVIDTAKVSGDYMILVSPNDSLIESYEFGPVYYDNTYTFFTLTDVFSKRKTIVYQKMH